MTLAKDTDRPVEMLRIPYAGMVQTFTRILLKHGFDPEKADQCARVFADSSLEGVSTHGVNRFPRFVHYVRRGYVRPQAEPDVRHRAGALEQWDGKLGPGPLNALFCTDRAMVLARESGIGCVGLSNTNHWMRGGTYGWRAARAGFVFLGWTNTIANMPAWGAAECRLGNNPLVIAVPYHDEAVVLDMAMSQFSYGTVEAHARSGGVLPMPGGYDAGGHLTTDSSAILTTQRLLPAGYWKGSGLALLLDLLATLLSGGSSTGEISTREAEYGVSQVFLAVDLSRLDNSRSIATVVTGIVDDLHRSANAIEGNVRYPGERVLSARRENLDRGIPVDSRIWEEVLGLV